MKCGRQPPRPPPPPPPGAAAPCGVPVHGSWTGPQVPSLLHTRVGLPTKVSSHEVTVTETGVLDAAVTGHEAKPSTSPELVGGQKTSAAAYAHDRSALTYSK